MPLALGWDSANHLLHPYAGLWAVGEVIVIGTVSAITGWVTGAIGRHSGCARAPPPN